MHKGKVLSNQRARYIDHSPYEPIYDGYLVKTDVFGLLEDLRVGLSLVGSTANTTVLYWGTIDPYWNYVCITVWKAYKHHRFTTTFFFVQARLCIGISMPKDWIHFFRHSLGKVDGTTSLR